MNPPRAIAVLGAGGWVGSALVKRLRQNDQPVEAVERGDLEQWLEAATPVNVIYAIGLTADFREKPHATAEAHVSLLSRIAQRPGVERLLYLSSTRVYGRSLSGHEQAPLPCLSSDPSDLYNLSKLLGEALVLQDQRPGFQVVRLSNVVGSGQGSTTFLGQLLHEAATHGRVRIEQAADTAKDYVSLSDVIRLLPEIASRGKKRLYNLASGDNTSHRQIAALIRQRGVTVELNEQIRGPDPGPCRLSIERLKSEFSPPAPGLDACRTLILGS